MHKPFILGHLGPIRRAFPLLPATEIETLEQAFHEYLDLIIRLTETDV